MLIFLAMTDKQVLAEAQHSSGKQMLGRAVGCGEARLG